MLWNNKQNLNTAGVILSGKTLCVTLYSFEHLFEFQNSSLKTLHTLD